MYFYGHIIRGHPKEVSDENLFRQKCLLFYFRVCFVHIWNSIRICLFSQFCFWKVQKKLLIDHFLCINHTVKLKFELIHNKHLKVVRELFQSFGRGKSKLSVLVICRIKYCQRVAKQSFYRKWPDDCVKSFFQSFSISRLTLLSQIAHRAPRILQSNTVGGELMRKKKILILA